MLRFYFCKAGASLADMSRPSLEAWTACQNAMVGFSESERNVIKSYFTTVWDESKSETPFTRTAELYGLPENEVRRIIDRCIKTVTVERGLADE